MERRHAVSVVAALIAALALPCTAAGQARGRAPAPAPERDSRVGADALIFGTWSINVAKSTDASGPPPVRRGTCTIEPWGDGVAVVYHLIRPRGGVTHLEWRGAFDGKDYPVRGVEDYVVTNAYRRIDDRTYEIVQKVDGEITATASVVISSDGKTLTTVTTTKTASGQDASSTTVYEKP